MSSTDLERLARWRTIGARHSEEVVELGLKVSKGGKVGDQEWALREQLAIAALDLGQIELSQEQIKLLHSKFPSSPRVKILDGLLLESQGRVEDAKRLYENLLLVDETNVSAHQRLISLTLSLSSPSSAIPPLLKYLDTFYSDPSGWSLLSELYCEQGMYVQSLDALGHLLSLQPWDEGAVRRAGEVAYTLGDYQLSLKHFLRSIEMQGTSETNPNPKRTRTWWGVKLAVSRLLESPNSETTVPPEMQSTEKQLKLLDELATEKILQNGGKGVGLEVKRKVLSDGREVVR
ncbi:hypothetical protein I302_102827 [Kwoniella bestiolae CBS 10118]|uniref:ER membrane protein complex subunit 2 n=1 Tax=Kwoniella bestiolae CBS 10118 TaxID=1296100 RepID=A0A1B9GGC6_9TREE|nr:hypothetical protein I302_01522 [Kwoniella bestiolae CBS 10118]OCF30005.1 hypothetical protein I302_01522 [Kwoniella bestiolae CBS 10118]